MNTLKNLKKKVSFLALGLTLSSGFASQPARAATSDDPVLESLSWLQNERARAASTYASTENLQKLYASLVSTVSVASGLSGSKEISLKSLLTKDASKLSSAQLKSAIASIANGIKTKGLVATAPQPFDLGEVASRNLPNSDCSTEIGYESGLDMQYTRRTAWATGSLVKNVNFPLRRHLSCIRNQGSRSTCTAFASTAALETLVHVDSERFVNLSEQHLYFWNYVNVDPDQSEGLPTEKAVAAMSSEGYRASLESGWQYNPSNYRTDKDSDGNLDGTFKDVCVGYTQSKGSVSSMGGEYCSETIHQGKETTIRKSYSSGGMDYTLTYHEYTAPSSATATAYGFGRTVQIYDDAQPDASLDLAKAYLQAGIPLVFGGGVTSNFKKNGQNGFVPYVRNEENAGGHAMLLVGWVDNADLPSGAPSGSGGGYFIFKNSWGMSSSNNDLGYYYAPYNYMREHTAGITAVTLR